MKAEEDYQFPGQISLFEILNPDTWSGKMSQEPLVQTGARTSRQSSPKSSGSSAQKLPMFLYLKTGDGQNQAASWVLERTDSRFPCVGDYTMHSFGEYPKDARESRLSQILEDNPHPKYCLSAKACQGILNRAERRGKQLPPLLRETLIRQATPLKSEGGVERDSNGRKAGKGPLIQTELSATLGVSQDQTLICLEGNGSRESHRGDGYKESETMFTLNTVEQHGVCFGISPMESNSMKSSNPHSGVYEAHTSRTLDLNGGNPACNQGGMMVVSVGNGQTNQGVSDKVGALNCMHDQQAIMVGLDAHNVSSTEERTAAILQGKNDKHNVPCVYGLDRASFNQGKNALYDFAVEEEIAQPIVARGPGGVLTP